jgi:TPR repeat protein
MRVAILLNALVLAPAVLPGAVRAEDSGRTASEAREQAERHAPAEPERKQEPKTYMRACEEIRRGNCARARRYLRPLAQKGHAKSQTLLGMMYETGAGVKKNSKTAAGWYEKAANQGLKEAENNLGHLYLNAEDSVRDPSKAEQWLNRAAEHGMVEAQHDLGVLYLHGDLVTKDHDKAVKWLKQAADQGSADARELLAKIPGVPKLENNVANASAQGGQNFSQGVANIEESWEGYADLAKSMQAITANN